MIRVPKAVALWICLAGTLVLFLLCLAPLHPTNWFGIYRDDALYFSSAKALAEGQGLYPFKPSGNAAFGRFRGDDEWKSRPTADLVVTNDLPVTWQQNFSITGDKGKIPVVADFFMTNDPLGLVMSVQ